MVAMLQELLVAQADLVVVVVVQVVTLQSQMAKVAQDYFTFFTRR
jgi:hypothetical protein